MHRIAGSFFSLIIAAVVCSLPAFALDPLAADTRGADNWTGGEIAAICEVGTDIDQPVLLAAYTGESPHVSVDAPPTQPGDPLAERADAAPPNTVLSMMQPGPRPPRVAARTGDVVDEQQEDWIRNAERTVPEPGLWAVLIAGFLSVCAMARRRIFSS